MTIFIRVEDDRHPVMDRLHEFIGIGHNDRTRLHNCFLLRVVPAFPHSTGSTKEKTESAYSAITTNLLGREKRKKRVADAAQGGFKVSAGNSDSRSKGYFIEFRLSAR